MYGISQNKCNAATLKSEMHAFQFFFKKQKNDQPVFKKQTSHPNWIQELNNLRRTKKCFTKHELLLTAAKLSLIIVKKLIFVIFGKFKKLI